MKVINSSIGLLSGALKIKRTAAVSLGLAMVTLLIIGITGLKSSAGPNGLQAAYSFNEGSGTSVADSSTTGNTGTISGATWSTAGKYGKALSFNGTNNYVSIADSTSLHLTNGMSLEAWVNPTSSSGSVWRTVVFKERPGGMAYALYANNGASRPTGQIYNSAERNAIGTAQVPTGVWTHLATTYDGANLKLYVNGTQVSSTAVTGNIIASSGALKIGGNAIWPEWFAGLIDEVRIYNRALPATEIVTDMNTPISGTPDTTAPTTPANFVKTASSATTISTSWTASTDNVGVSGYGMYLNGALIATSTSTAYTFTGLTCGTTYNLSVDAYDAAGNRSAQAFLTTTSAACDTTPPSAPTNVAVTSTTTTSIAISWTASTDNVGVTGYGLYTGGQTPIATTTTTSYAFTGLNCGSTYSFGVDAYDARGNRSPEVIINATTQACGDTTAPTTPTNLAATASTTTSVSVSWTASTDNVAVTGYGLYNVGSVPIATTTSTTYTFTGLVCGTAYTLGVDAFDAAGNRSAQVLVNASTSTCPVSTGLVVGYNFNETSGTTANDLSGSGNNGAITGATRSTLGKYGGALLFNGTSNFVSTADSTSLHLTNGMSLEAWVNPNALGTTGTSWRTVVFKEQPAGMNYALYANNGSARPTGQVNIGGEKNAAGSAQLSLNVWTHLTTTFDGSNLRLYVNGSLVSTTAVSGSISPSTGLLKIGGNAIWGSEFFSGLIDEVRVYNRALSGGEITTDMNTPVGGTLDTTPPSAPTNLTATGSIGSAQLNWTAATDNVAVTGYNVYRSSFPGFTPAPANKIGTSTITSYSDSGLSAGTYYYRVTAQDAAGNIGASSNEASAVVTSDSTAPTVSITSPTDGTTVSNSVTVSANASDDVSVAGVQFKLDGNNLGSEDTSSPYSVVWSTNGATNGSHNLTAVARDNSGHLTTSTAVSVTVSNTTPVTPIPIPAANVNGINVGEGYVDHDQRQIVRTANNVVYMAAADDNPCQVSGGGKGLLHMWKGVGSQPGNASVPTSFVELDVVNRPLPVTSGTCNFSSTNGSPVLSSPDVRLDRNGIIHMVYIDMSINNNNVYYQTFSTLTDTWGPRVVLATNGMPNNGLGWARQGQTALTLDSNDVPHVVYSTAGPANQLMYTNKLSGSWSVPVSLASGTWSMHASMVTSLDGTIHLSWLDDGLATHAIIKYAHYSGGAWGPIETVTAGDSNVLSNGDGDQGPSMATDTNNVPHVLFMDGIPNSSDNYVRVRYRTTAGVWTDNSPPGTPGGPSNSSGNWFAHAPENYISSTNDSFVFLGHDRDISPAVFEYQLGGPGNNWSPSVLIDPRNGSNTTAGEIGIDGSAGIRFDPLRDNNPGIIDVLYFDENDGTPGYAHHATLFYKAIIIR